MFHFPTLSIRNLSSGARVNKILHRLDPLSLWALRAAPAASAVAGTKNGLAPRCGQFGGKWGLIRYFSSE